MGAEGASMTQPCSASKPADCHAHCPPCLPGPCGTFPSSKLHWRKPQLPNQAQWPKSENAGWGVPGSLREHSGRIGKTLGESGEDSENFGRSWEDLGRIQGGLSGLKTASLKSGKDLGALWNRGCGSALAVNTFHGWSGDTFTPQPLLLLALPQEAQEYGHLGELLWY